MNHLQTHWMDTENNVFRGDPDDFKLPRDDDDGELERQQDTDFNAEVKRIQAVLKRARQNSLFQRQAD